MGTHTLILLMMLQSVSSSSAPLSPCGCPIVAAKKDPRRLATRCHHRAAGLSVAAALSDACISLAVSDGIVRGWDKGQQAGVIMDLADM